MKLLLGIAAIWLGLGLMLVLLGLPTSITGDWRQGAYLILFGPPLWIFAEAFFEIVRHIFVPKSIETWRPIWRIMFYLLYALVLFSAWLGVIYFFKTIK